MANCLNLLKRSQNYVPVVQSLLQRIYTNLFCASESIFEPSFASFCDCVLSKFSVRQLSAKQYCRNVVLLKSISESF